MKNQFRRELAIVIVMLFVGASFIPAIVAVETENQNTDSNNVSTTDGNTDNTDASNPDGNTNTPLLLADAGLVHNTDTGENFNTIQAAIDDPDTLDGHTIMVDAGNYTENIVVNKAISLISEDQATTIIEPVTDDNTITVTASNAVISGFIICNMHSHRASIWLFEVNGVTVSENTLTGYYGMYLEESTNCHIYHNNFVGEKKVYEDNMSSANHWDNGYPSGGNYWSDYSWADNCRGPNQNILGSDGIGDMPYSIFSYSENYDFYPLMEPAPYTPLVGTATNINTGEDFPTIQEAIDDSDTLNGHTILVDAGFYNERIVIDKSISLIGEGQDTTFIYPDQDDEGDAVTITADNVVFSGFTVTNSYGNYIDLLVSNVHGVTITDNTISSSWYTLYIAGSTGCHIYHNNIGYNSEMDEVDGNPAFANEWDNGYPSGGNYWDGYSYTDDNHGPNQDHPGADGISDIPYNIHGAANIDRYPLVYPAPYTPVDLPIIDITYPENGNLVYNPANPIIFTGTAYDLGTSVDSVIVKLYYTQGGVNYYWGWSDLHMTTGWYDDVTTSYPAAGTGSGTLADPLHWECSFGSSIFSYNSIYHVYAEAADHDDPSFSSDNTNWFYYGEELSSTIIESPAGESTLSTGEGTFESYNWVNEYTLPQEAIENKPVGLELPFGLFDFTITNLTFGSSVILTITLPNPVPTGSQWWKVNPNDNSWYSLPIGSDDGDNIVEITLYDGGPGDNDGTIDGVIHDPGGIGGGVIPIQPVHNLNSDKYFDTIQAAIDDDDTLSGDTITVNSGIYQESIHSYSKGLTLQGIDTGAGLPLLDANGESWAGRFHQTVSFSNFYVKNAVDYGLYMTGNSNTVNNVYFMDNQGDGLYIASISYNTVNYCWFENNGMGLYCWGISSSDISYNTFKANQNGLYLDTATGNTLAHNSIFDNTGEYAISCQNSNDNTFCSNLIYNNNGYGLRLSSSNANTIYNNYFNANTFNVEDYSTNTWNIDMTPGTNIIGGPNLGGNYWSDFASSDSNGDGFGDTSYTTGILYGGDTLPLIPSARYVSPTTGGIAWFWTYPGVFSILTGIEEGSLSPEAQNNKPAGLSLPFGLFNFTITGLNYAEMVTVTMTLPGNVPIGSSWWKVNPNNDTWYSLPIGSDDGDNVITINLQDGELGDHDGMIDQKIVDPGGIGEPLQPSDYTYTVSNGEATITGYTGTGVDITIPSLLGGCPVVAIGDNAFNSNNGHLITSVIIPDSVTFIGDSAFQYCFALTSVTIGSSVTHIGNYAFEFTALTSVTIPDSVTKIWDCAFAGCASLTSINVAAGNLFYSNYAGDGVLYNKAITTLIQCPGGKTGVFIIPDCVMILGGSAFFWCTSLTSVTIPDSITGIPGYAFSHCWSMTHITIPANVTEIVFYAFEYCTALTSITFLGLVAPTTVGANWIQDTPAEIRGHAYAASNFPAPGGVFNGLTMGTVIVDVNDVYVDDNYYDGGINDGHTWGYDAFNTIQGGIDGVETGGFVNVNNGLYPENVLINKPVQLYGQDRDNTIVDGGNNTNTFTVTASHVVINGFKITNGNSMYPNAGIFLDNVEGSIINHNDVSGNNGHGIFSMWGTGNQIYDNILTDNKLPAIRIDGTEANAHVYENTITQNLDMGIFTYNADTVLIENNIVTENGFHAISSQGNSINIIICNNTITQNLDSGIFTYSVDTVLIENNVITDNGMFGISPQGNSKNITIRYNTITNNVWHGIFVAASPNGCTLFENTIQDNQQLGIYLSYSNATQVLGNTLVNDGLFVRESFGNTVTQNIVNGRPLVYCEGESNHGVDASAGQVVLVNCQNIVVEGCDLSLTDIGLELWDTSNSMIFDNNFSDNSFYGVITADSSNSMFYHNNFDGNVRNPVYIPTYASASVNIWGNGYPSGGNYWSNYSGVDNNHGTGQDRIGLDGKGDTAFVLNGNNQDRYPYMEYDGWLLNYPPYPVNTPNPVNGSTDVPVSVTLSWLCDGDPNPHDLVAYDVFFGTTTPPTLASAGLTETTYTPPTLAYDTLYYWQIVANDKIDNIGASTPGPIWQFITEPSMNTPPVANAGPDQTVFVTATVTLNGAASSDADNDPLTYNWSIISKPAGSTAVLSDHTVVNPTFVVDKPGSYVIQLIVNDGTVNSAPDTITVSTMNSPPVANAGPDQTVYVGTTVTLSGSASSDVDGDPLTYNWSIISKPAGSTAVLSDHTVVNPTFVVDKPGSYVIQLIVNDGTVNSTPDTVTITTMNQPPVAVDDTATVNEDSVSNQINVLINDYDIDGDSLQIISVTDPPHGTTTTDGDYVFYTPDPDYNGADVFSYTISDGNGGTDTADVTITVTPQGLPDLTIISFTVDYITVPLSDFSARLGPVVRLTATIKNIGQEPVTQPFYVTFYRDESTTPGQSLLSATIGQVLIPSLNVGATATAIVNWRLQPDTETVLVVVDSGGVIHESNERNNEAQTELPSFILWKSLTTKVDVYTKLGQKYHTPSALKVVQNATIALQMWLYTKPDAYVRSMKNITGHEEMVGIELNGQVPPVLLERYNNLVQKMKTIIDHLIKPFPPQIIKWDDAQMVAKMQLDICDLVALMKRPLGDANCDGIVNWRDIDHFVYALNHTEDEFQMRYPSGSYWAADCNQDGYVNWRDIDPFVALMC